MQPLSRRGFLQIGGSALMAMSFQARSWPRRFEAASFGLVGLGRVTYTAIYFYQQPEFKAERQGFARKDQILKIYEEVISPAGPAHNPRWYRVDEGYVHSGYIQRVEEMRLNIPPLAIVPEEGQLGQITVPYTQSYRWVRGSGWLPLYRLYYSSIHWITGVGDGPTGNNWYQLTDDLLHVAHYIPATHIRPITPEELLPISPEVPADEKHIEVSLAEQVLYAYEADTLVLTAKVSTGIPSQNPQPDEIPTDTPPGRYYLQTKFPCRHMGDGRITSDLQAYELPGVPWVSIFHKDGLALHGTFWHDNFGRRMSHGCINLRNEDARWIYRWSMPAATHKDWYVRELGTRLDIK